MADSATSVQPDPRPRPYPWQTEVWQQLTTLHRQGRLPHALLLSGPAGTGKREFAAALTEFVLCRSSAEFACGQCKACLLNQQGTHPDRVMIAPEEAGKAIRVDQIRALADFVGSASQQGGFRVLVIYPADEMNINAANALLKSLEEPGRDTLFILVSDRPGRVMPTIRSRCQQYPLPLPSAAQALSWLCGQVDQDQAELLLRLSGGAPLAAAQLHEQQGIEGRRKRFEALQQLIRRQVSASSIAASWAKDDSLLLLEWLASIAGDLVRLRMGSSDATLRNIDAVPVLEKLSELTSEEKLFEFRDKIQEYRSHLMRRSNPNQQLLWEDLLIDWRALFTSRTKRAK